MSPEQSRKQPGRMQQKMFIASPKTDFADFWRETDEFINNHPEILDSIRADQNRVGRSKKLLRIKDRRYRKKQNKQAEPLDIELDQLRAGQLPLEGGRPRMSPWLVFMFMMARGYKGGVSTREFQDFIQESMTVYAALQRRGEKMPGRTTISENLNAVSNRTRLRILEAQVEEIIQEGLDDFGKMTLDSTAVSSASEWPNDAVLIKKLIERVWTDGNKLEEFGLENFDRHWMETWVKKMSRCVLEIKTASHAGTRKKKYRRLFHFADNAIEHLQEQKTTFEQSLDPKQFRPSRREKLETLRDRIREGLKKARKKLETARSRVLDGEGGGAKKKC